MVNCPELNFLSLKVCHWASQWSLNLWRFSQMCLRGDERNLTCRLNGLHLCTHKSLHQRAERTLKVSQYKALVANHCRYGNPCRHATHSWTRLKLPNFAEDYPKYCCKLGGEISWLISNTKKKVEIPMNRENNIQVLIRAEICFSLCE